MPVAFPCLRKGQCCCGDGEQFSSLLYPSVLLTCVRPPLSAPLLIRSLPPLHASVERGCRCPCFLQMRFCCLSATRSMAELVSVPLLCRRIRSCCCHCCCCCFFVRDRIRPVNIRSSMPPEESRAAGILAEIKSAWRASQRARWKERLPHEEVKSCC